MKLIFVAYNEALDEEIMEALQAAGLENFTRFKRVEGRGSGSGYHLGNHIWPGFVNVLMVGCDDVCAARLMAEVRELKTRFGHEGIKAFMLPVEEII